jgi:2-polyprenyl-3-methyl-5-hydroxy-6-metoxy-1,4-benzoquinol methylase
VKEIKFSKSYKNIALIKKNFISDNEKFLSYAKKINAAYIKQVRRTNCKNCSSKISKPFLKNFGIEYCMCVTCGHLNGIYEDTQKFNKWLYSSENGKNYNLFYNKFYAKRVKNIHVPKVNFLKKVIKEKIKVIDYGSGVGYFLKALEIKKIQAIGLETNKQSVKAGNKFLKKNKLLHFEFGDNSIFKKHSNEYNTLALIGVLEHIDPTNLLKEFRSSKLKYLYISVPALSLSVFLENVFPKVFPRVLSNGHTHLYTNKSLNYFAKKNNLKIIGEWWFGTDIPDLFRSLFISANFVNKKIYTEEINKIFKNTIDQLQNVLDKNKTCSEIHMVFQKKQN